MKSNPNIHAIIPARSGSRRLPNKNFKYMCGVPLWGWSFDHAMLIPAISEISVIVSNESRATQVKERIGDSSTTHVVRRPDYLSSDACPTQILVEWYFVTNPEVDRVVVLQPTSPLRDVDLVKAILDEESFGEWDHPVRTVDVVHEEPDGQVFIYSRESLRNADQWEDIVAEQLWSSVDIDDQYDWNLAEHILRGELATGERVIPPQWRVDD